MGEQLESKFTGFINNFTRFLEGINDVNFGNSDLGRFLGYEDMKPKLERGRGNFFFRIFICLWILLNFWFVSVFLLTFFIVGKYIYAYPPCPGDC